MNDPDVGRKDITWAQVNDDDLVIVQTPDTNRLAMGGIPIETISGNTVTTKSGFFTTATTGTGANAKPQLSAGDIIEIFGIDLIIDISSILQWVYPKVPKTNPLAKPTIQTF